MCQRDMCDLRKFYYVFMELLSLVNVCLRQANLIYPTPRSFCEIVFSLVKSYDPILGVVVIEKYNMCVFFVYQRKKV